jgi:transposase
VIRIYQIWLATEPLDMRAGPDKALARVVQVFGSARPHCAYLFANKRANRMKVLIHDGLGIWLCARRLNRGKFHWTQSWRAAQVSITDVQLHALVQGLPWHTIGEAGVISIL